MNMTHFLFRFASMFYSLVSVSYTCSESVPRDLVSRDDRLLLLTVSHHESLLPNDFLGEVAVPFCDLDSMQGVTSLEEIPARMLPLRRPKQPHDGVFCVSVCFCNTSYA